MGNAALVTVAATGRRQAGVALITVLLIVFLATVAATSLASLEQYAVHRSTLLQHQQQARFYALGAEQWAALILKRDLQHDLEDDRRVDSLDKDWAVMSPTLPVQGGFVKGRIQDMQSCFNLNNLLRAGKRTEENVDPAQQRNLQGARRAADRSGEDEDAGEESAPEQDNAAAKAAAAAKNKGDGGDDDEDKDVKDKDKDSAATEGKAANKPQLKVFKRLLEVLKLEPSLSDAILDWMDIDQDRRPDGAEDSDYAGGDPPYATADRWLTSVSELRLVKGIDSAVYNKLAPYVCVLPPDTKLNVNTASPVVLAALDEDRDPDRFTKRKEDGKKQVYEKVEDFLEEHRLGGEGAKRLLDVNSHYFRVDIEAQVGDGRALLHSVLERGENGEMRVLYRSFSNEL